MPTDSLPAMRAFCLALVSITTGLVGCASAPPGAADDAAATEQILAVLNAETQAALGRDYERWRTHWVHAPYVVKTYTDETDGTASVTLGWRAVDDFVLTYLEEHPEPETPPAPLEDADVRLYGDRAWVVYDQLDADQGWKRETRRMERVDGAWRIAAMHTTITGRERPE